HHVARENSPAMGSEARGYAGAVIALAPLGAGGAISAARVDDRVRHHDFTDTDAALQRSAAARRSDDRRPHNLRCPLQPARRSLGADADAKQPLRSNPASPLPQS